MDIHSFSNFDAVTLGAETAGSSPSFHASSTPSIRSKDAVGASWDHGTFPSKDSWSWALDTLLSGTIGNEQSLTSTASSLSLATSGRATSTSYETSVTGGSCGEESFTLSGREWRYILSTTPSDPFNIFGSIGSQEREAAPQVSPKAPEGRSATLSSASIPLLHDDETQGQWSSSPTPPRVHAFEQPAMVLIPRPSASRPPPPPAPFRLARNLNAIPIEHQTSISPVELVKARHELSLDSLQQMSAGNGSETGVIPSVRGRGLSGWNPTNATDDLPVMCSTSSQSALTLPPLRPPCPRPSVVRQVPRQEAPPVVPLAQRRPRRSAKPSMSSFPSLLAHETYQTVNSDEDNDSDGYEPSNSSESIAPSRPSSPSSFRFPSPDLETRAAPRPRKKGKAKGSAALALAVVTQLSKLQNNIDSSASHLENSDVDDQDLESSLVQPGRKRKNHPIPLPVPVPDLIKKSRGRKVPERAEDASAWDALLEEDEEEEFQPLRGSRNTRGRKPVTAYSLGEGGKRTFKCEVKGCGKCFVRGEHLKRHVRSIHTYDKPHPCPFDGCDKSFSRRDNLGQHVRVHLLS